MNQSLLEPVLNVIIQLIYLNNSPLKILKSTLTEFAITRIKHSVITNVSVDPEIGNILECRHLIKD